jgi:hypothetical protein
LTAAETRKEVFETPATSFGTKSGLKTKLTSNCRSGCPENTPLSLCTEILPLAILSPLDLVQLFEAAPNPEPLLHIFECFLLKCEPIRPLHDFFFTHVTEVKFHIIVSSSKERKKRKKSLI